MTSKILCYVDAGAIMASKIDKAPPPRGFSL